MKVVSLLPAATEIVAALGALDALVAVSHDCDHPPQVRELPWASRSILDEGASSSAAVDRAVHEGLAQHGSLYRIDEALLRRLAPQLILSQRLCDVCAPSHGSVAALAAELPGAPRVLDLEPKRLAHVFENVRTVAGEMGLGERGERVVAELERRVEAVCDSAGSGPYRPRCVVLEWLEPLFASGHWVPELVALAGGEEPVGRAGEPSRAVAWDRVREAEPDVLVIAACGRSVSETLPELDRLRDLPGWEALPAVRRGEVYVMDGSAYLSRPGPRLVEALEVLGGILHPERCPAWRPEAWPPEVVAKVGPG